MKLLHIFFSLFSLQSNANQYQVANKCITFYVSSGTGCAWMCNYCASNLGTDNYYFTDGVCTYEENDGCVGNPIAGNSYTCCSA
jgi:hypothetical protein